VSAPPLLEMRGIAKAFPGVRALDDVSLDVQAGEVHTLVGQNGAGKSTLIRVLYGACAPDRGEILFRGETVRIASPADARRLGVAVIFQEFSLVPYLDIAHNIFLGREFRGRIPGSIDHRRMHAESRRLLALLGMDVDTRTPAHRLGVAQQQLVEIAKALSQDARLLVMDEPTAALSEREIERLFKVISMLKQDGVAIIYISHRLREVFATGGPAGVALLDEWIGWAKASSSVRFRVVGRRVEKHRAGIVASLLHGLSNGRVEAVNTHVRLIARIAYGFHSADALIALAMLRLGGVCPPLPGR
jgi:ABC-type sugar transport system ATPase subunit